MSDFKIISGQQPKLVGAKVGETVVIKQTNNQSYRVIYTSYDGIGVQGQDLNNVKRPLRLFPWTNIMSVTKDEDDYDGALRLS